MSVSVEQPLHFSQQPSSPSFSSPPHSPNHRLHAQTPASPPPPPPADVDMSTSVPTLAPAGQRHDREDADMHDGNGLTNGHADEPLAPPNHPQTAATNVAIEVAAIDDDDAMDTAPDVDTQPDLPNGSGDAAQTAAVTPSSPPANGPATVDHDSNAQAAQADLQSTETQTEQNLPQDPLLLSDPSFQPPPPPPPVEAVRSDSDSSDDDDGLQPWHPVQEDTSLPDEVELKEIEASEEHSALDHEYWESKAFLPLEEPEYTAGETGRITWTIDAYNGTREKPNRDIVMKSDIVTVGGHQWQIKFYPKGNDSDYLSVYLECLSVMDPKKQEEDAKHEDSSEVECSNKDTSKETDTMETTESAPAVMPDIAVDAQHAPLPLLGTKRVPKRKSVAAQVSVVLYNPTEPRVHYSRTALHRFCGGSPDWGWTRFHGPYYDIAHRMRGQRSALLRNDKLAFTGYIRVVEDQTDCLWEHHSRENPWDSFAMTGLQSLVLGEDASAPGGNMISAIASWLLFKPFRDVLYSVMVPDPEEAPFIRPKPLLTALQKVLFMLRTHVDPGAGSVALDEVLDALEWYGIHDRLDKLDVVEVWEVLRVKLEEELQGTSHAQAMTSLFGTMHNATTGNPSYRVPVLGVETMQEAINSATDFIAVRQPLPQLLAIELDRQYFDIKTRSYVKVLNKVSLEDVVTVGDTSYTLYGFVVHKQTLQSYVYQPIIRPEGPGSRWYSYSDSKDENQVTCLTQRQAIDDHEGKPGKEYVFGNDAVAYIAMYIRGDVAEAAFISDADTEKWSVPEWLSDEVEKERASSMLPPMPPLHVEASTLPSSAEGKTTTAETEEPVVTLDFQVVNSEIFRGHEGPGIYDAYDPKWQVGSSGHIHMVQLGSNFSCSDIREKLASVLPNIQDHRQITFWFMDPVRGSLGRPQLLSTGKTLYSRGSHDRYTEDKDWTLADSSFACRYVWVHIIEFSDLPKLSEPTETQSSSTKDAQTSSATDVMQTDTSNAVLDPLAVLPRPEVIPHSEDTPMSEPEESPVPPAEPPIGAEDNDATNEQIHSQDAAMVEVESASGLHLPVVDVPVPPEPTSVGDTEMGGTQEEMSLPPPPPVGNSNEMAHPPPPPERIRTPEPPVEEIYFFLKLWNAEQQRLESRGSYISQKSARVDETVVKLLGLPIEDKKKVEIWEEEELTSTRTIKHRRTFAQLDLPNTVIIIASLPITTEQRSALADRAAFAEPQSYLAYRAFARNFPSKLNGHFEYKYFSAQYYKGEIKNGHRHGHGLRIYHSGATYSGSFRLGRCHGHGLYTFQNGDTYDGDWVDDQQHGSGTFVEGATGNTYVGGWKNDKKFGEGVTHWKNAQEAERICRICWDEPAEAAFYDCGHVVACLACAREVQNCPVCRKRVLSAMKLYYVA